VHIRLTGAERRRQLRHLAQHRGDCREPDLVGQLVLEPVDFLPHGAGTFHHPDTQANVITTEYSDRATNCPEYKVAAVQISPSNGPSEWQKAYDEQARHSRRIAPVVEAAE
jgi:predicted molibdopterin-dependent oxidoreductase YjgC